MVMVAIPAGTFMMGAPDNEPCRDEDEGPQHPVTISGFYLAESEVTVAQFKQFIEATKCKTTAEKAGDSNSWQKP